MGFSIYDVDNSLKKLAMDIIQGQIKDKDPTTLSYYGMRLEGAIDKLERNAAAVPVVSQIELAKKAQIYKTALAKLRSDIVDAQGEGCIYFSDISKKKDLKKNPIVSSLEKNKLKGKMLSVAIRITAGDTGLPELAVSNFIKDNEIEYPEIDETSESYKLGQEDARRLVLARVKNVEDKMYQSQQDFLRHYPKKDADQASYIAGFSNVASSGFSFNFLENERAKGNFLSTVDKYIK